MKYCVITFVFRRDDPSTVSLLMGLKETGEIGKLTYNAPGGKIDFYDKFGYIKDRNPKDAAKREPREETDALLLSHQLTHLANILFHSAGEPTFLAAVYVAWVGPNEDMPVHDTKDMSDVGWKRVDNLPYDRMAEGDPHWFPKVIAGEQFDASVFYEDGINGFLDIMFEPFTGLARYPVPVQLLDTELPLLPEDRKDYEQVILTNFEPHRVVLAKRGTPIETLNAMVRQRESEAGSKH